MRFTLTEARAWREIAQRRATRPGRYLRHGLCHQVRELYREERISSQCAKWMLDRLTEHLPEFGRGGRPSLHAYYVRMPRFECSVRTLREASEGRLFAALWFARDAHEEQRNWGPSFVTLIL